MLVTANDTLNYQINNSRPGAVLREESADIGFGEAYSREYDSFKALNMFTSRANNLYDEYDREIDRIRMSGAPAPRNPLDVGSFDEGDDRIAEKRIAKFHQEAEVLRGGGYEPRSFEQIETDVAARVRGIKEKAAEGHDTASAFWARLGAGAVVSIQDPVNITAMGITAPFGGWGGAVAGTLRGAALAVGKTAVFEGAVNMATESAIQPFVAQYHHDVGLPYSMEEAAFAIAGAGIGGAVLGGAMRAGGIAIRASLRRGANAWEMPGDALADAMAALDPTVRGEVLSHFPPGVSRVLDPDVPVSARGMLDALDDLQASGHVADSRVAGARAVLDDMVWLSESNPFLRSGQSDLLHEMTVTATVRALDNGDFAPLTRAIEAQHAHRHDAFARMAQRVFDDPVGTVGDQYHTWHGSVSPEHVAGINQALADPANAGHGFTNADMLVHAIRQIDDETIRHAMNRHAADEIPLKPDDFRHIPDVLENGEFVKTMLDKKNRLTIVRRKLVDGNWLYVGESLRSGNKPTLDFRTAYWERGPKERGGFDTAPERSFHQSDVRLEEAPPTNALGGGDDPVSLKVSPPPDVVNRLADVDAALLTDARAIAEANDLDVWLDVAGADGVNGTVAVKARDLLRQADNAHKTAELLRGCAIGGA